MMTFEARERQKNEERRKENLRNRAVIARQKVGVT